VSRLNAHARTSGTQDRDGCLRVQYVWRHWISKKKNFLFFFLDLKVRCGPLLPPRSRAGGAASRRAREAREGAASREACRPWDGQRKRQRSAASWARAVPAPSSFATRWPTSRRLSMRTTTALRLAQVKSTASRPPPRAQAPAERVCKPKPSRWSPRSGRPPYLPCGQRSGCAHPRAEPHSCAARSESFASSRSLSTWRSPGY